MQTRSFATATAKWNESMAIVSFRSPALDKNCQATTLPDRRISPLTVAPEADTGQRHRAIMVPDLVTTVIPVYNRARMLREAAESAISQTHRPIEVIIVDDGSSDDTPDMARRLAARHPGVIRLIRKENAGPGAARNAGLQQARGEFIQYLDSDDLLEPRKFELQVKALADHPEAGVCYCVTLRRNSTTSEMVPWAKTDQRIENIFPDFLPKRGWATLTPLWRRSVCDAIGPWGDLRVMEDWEHDLRAGMLGVRTVHVAEPLAIVRDHTEDRASGMNTGFTPKLTREFFRAHRSVWTQMRERNLTDWSYLAAFSRQMFWVARMCGRRGLIDEAEEALSFAEQMNALHHAPREIRFFRRLTQVLGWRVAVCVSEAVRTCLRGRRSVGKE